MKNGILKHMSNKIIFLYELISIGFMFKYRSDGNIQIFAPTAIESDYKLIAKKFISENLDIISFVVEQDVNPCTILNFNLLDIEAKLSYGQERLWFIDRYEGGSDAYNVPLLFRLGKDANIAILADAIFNIVYEYCSCDDPLLFMEVVLVVDVNCNDDCIIYNNIFIHFDNGFILLLLAVVFVVVVVVVVSNGLGVVVIVVNILVLLLLLLIQHSIIL